MLVVVLAVFCGLHQYVAPFEVDREPMVFPPSMALPTTEFILLIQVVAFFRRSVEDRLPAFLPGAGAIYLTIVTDVMPGESAQRSHSAGSGDGLHRVGDPFPDLAIELGASR